MPRDQLMGDGGGKQPLRDLLGRLLPSVDFNRAKSGFGVPIADLLRRELNADLRDAITTNATSMVRFEHDWSSELADLEAGDDSPAPLLWSLLMLEYWCNGRVTDAV